MNKPIEIMITESQGITRFNEPITVGVPFPKGDIFNPLSLKLCDESGQEYPVAFTPLSKWTDGSIKWLLLNFNVHSDAYTRTNRIVAETSQSKTIMESVDPVLLTEDNVSISINTGSFMFVIGKTGPLSFTRISDGPTNTLSKPSAFVLNDANGIIWNTRIDQYDIERNNSMTCILTFAGDFISDEKIHGLRFKCRFYFYAGKGTVRIDFTVWNPEASKHPGGAWDLGDESSIFIKELKIVFPIAQSMNECLYGLQPEDDARSFSGEIDIYQDSSGGKNWRSKNHVNRHGDIPLCFQGYKVSEGDTIMEKGKRATPHICIMGGGTSLSCTMPWFWQNFPKGLCYKQNILTVHLFPGQFQDLYEIQGGEQKTHTIYINVSNDSTMHKENYLGWVHYPLEVSLPPEIYYNVGMSPGIIPVKDVIGDSCYSTYQDYIGTAIESENSLFERREIIDEYGWRNFGELYADHESVFYKGDDGFISHYNNQYDGVKGSLYQFMRSGNHAWWCLAKEMAWHVAEIDIYRTKKDRYQFNGGLFWHTDHHLDAATATHRTISKNHLEHKDPRFFGGGPSYDHVYSTGFCYFYWMTGESLFKESALLLAQYAISGIKGPDTLTEYCLKSLKSIIRKLKGTTDLYPYGFNGPGRGSGNVLNTMVDAYLLTSDFSYLRWANRLIHSCVSPNDDIESHDLLNAELRWMYTVFLQSLGRYLDVIREYDETHEFFNYARDSFLTYAEWMRDHEYPYLDRQEILEFPNETWAAQDIRKSDIFAIASRYCKNEDKSDYLQKSRYFFEKSLEHLLQFGENSYLTRPIIIMMSNGHAHMDVTMASLSNNDQNKVAEPCAGDRSIWKKPSVYSRIMYEVENVLGIIKNTSLRKEISLLKTRIASK